MRLLYVAHGYTTHDRRFLEALSRDRFEVHYLRLSSVTLDRRPLPPGVVPVSWVGDRLADGAAFGNVRRWLPLRRIVRDLGARVALAGPVPTAAFLLALTGFGPFVAMSWGSDLLVDARQSRVAGAKAGYALRRAAGFFGDCRAVADEARRRASIPEDRTVLFPWGIDHGQFFAGRSSLPMRNELGWEDKRVVICTRSWEPVYAVDVLVQAFAAVAPEFVDARLLLLGDGPRAADIRKLIDALGVRERVHAPGRIGYDALPEYFRVADIFASAALSDGSSVSLLEAMASGLPAVVTGAFGNLEWVRPGENGWLAEPGSVDSLARCLREALGAPATRLAEIGRANIAVARERADWDRNFPRLSELLRRVGARVTGHEAPFAVGRQVYVRGLARADLPAMVEWINDTDVTRLLYMGDRPAHLELLEEQWALDQRSQRDIVFAVCNKSDDAFIGTTGLYQIHWIMRTAEFRIFLGAKQYWNRGIGTECTRLMVVYGFDKLNLNRIYLGVNAENTGGVKAYEKAGFVHEGVHRQEQYRNFRYYDVIRMGMLRSVYEPIRDDYLNGEHESGGE